MAQFCTYAIKYLSVNNSLEWGPRGLPWNRAARLMEAAHVENHYANSGENITAGGELLQRLKAENHNEETSQETPSRRPGRGGKRGRGRLGVATRSLGSRGAQENSRGRPHDSSLLSSLAHEADFCFGEANGWNETGVSTSVRDACKYHACGPVAALHGLLTPQAAAAAFAAGTNLSTEWGEETAVHASAAEIVQAVYEETPEGHFLITADQSLPDSANTIKVEQCAFDLQSLRRDLIPFPIPVRFWRTSGSKSARQQELRSGVCVVPPLMSAAPQWCDWGERNSEEEGRAYGAAQEDSSRVAGNNSVREGDERKSISEADALMNVGGSILAVAVSQECSVTEALDVCRERQERAAGDEGFVVMAVSVGPVQRVAAHAFHPAINTPTPDDTSSSSTNDSLQAGVGRMKSGALPASSGDEDGQPLWQQQRKATGHVQLWTISSNPSIKPRLRVILQDDGSTFRSLHWIDDSQLLSRCTDDLCVDSPLEGERSANCGCSKGADCYRSRLGLLCGVTDSGVLVMWSVPLAPFLPEPEDGFSRTEALPGVDCGSKRVPHVSACEVERRPSKTGGSVAQAVEPHMRNGIRCCVLPPVWKFKSPNVRFFCCAAAPGRGASAIARESLWQEPVVLVGGAGEGRLYVFSFSAEPLASQHSSSHVAGLASSSDLTLLPCRSLAERLRCSLYVLTPGCQSSEVRCCSFLPSRSSSLVAVALRSSRSRSGSVMILDLRRASVAASAGCSGAATVQGHSVVADTAALQVVEGNCGCYRSREIHDLAWCPWSRYLVASAENALIINLLKQEVKQLPLHTLQDSRGGKSNNSSGADGRDRCCWSCTSLGPLFFYTFSGGCLVQGEAAALEQRGQGSAVCWQWRLADADDQRELLLMLEKQPDLVQAQRVAERELKVLRRTLLDLLKEQMAGLASSESPQQSQPQLGLSVDSMQQRVDTLLAVQQLEERCELLSRGLVIAEGGSSVAGTQKGGKRGGGQVPGKTSSILALRKDVAALGLSKT
ncbi:hypothetical protein Emed_000371 [Eimeria media]